MNRILVYGLSQDKLGGIETFLLNMNKFMSNEMIFDYVIEGDHTIHQSEIDKKGGKCFYISPKKKALVNLRDWKKLLNEQKDNYKIIYFNLYSLAWIFPIVIALKRGYKVIVHAHNNKLHNCGIIQKVLHAINRQFQKHLKIIRFTNSELSSKFFFDKQKSELIYNAIDLDRFVFKEKKRDEIRTRLDIDMHSHLYGFSGRLAFEKNPLFLVDIFYKLSLLDKKALFIVCGDGDLKEDMIKKANDYGLNILFTGNVKNVEDYYCAMDCFILPSRFEGLGIVLIEAQASGLVCFASNKVIPEMAKQTDLLHFIDLKDGPNEWARIIASTITKFKYRESPLFLKKSRFNIVIESRLLENSLLSKKGN